MFKTCREAATSVDRQTHVHSGLAGELKLAAFPGHKAHSQDASQSQLKEAGTQGDLIIAGWQGGLGVYKTSHFQGTIWDHVARSLSGSSIGHAHWRLIVFNILVQCILPPKVFLNTKLISSLGLLALISL